MLLDVLIEILYADGEELPAERLALHRFGMVQKVNRVFLADELALGDGATAEIELLLTQSRLLKFKNLFHWICGRILYRLTQLQVLVMVNFTVFVSNLYRFDLFKHSMMYHVYMFTGITCLVYDMASFVVYFLEQVN